MLIDFHTHIFPDKVALKAIPLLAEKAGITPYTDGTVLGLSKKTSEAGLDYSVALPVATADKQVESINTFAIGINNNNKDITNVISFGAMHPDYENYEAELLRVKEAGIKGIKLHPAYQNVFIDDDRYVRIIDKAFELGLIVIIHSGIDIGIPGEVAASPDRILNCYGKLTHKGIFVLAHMGSWEQWDEVYVKILGKDFYIDTAFSLGGVTQRGEAVPLMDYDEFTRFVRKHGAEKVLFGTDTPWANTPEYLEWLKKAPLTEEEKDLILGGNARRLLNL